MTALDDASVLLLIDLQRAFDREPWPRRWNHDVDRNGLAVLAAWRRAGRPVIHVRHDSVEPGSTLASGLPGNMFREGFEPLPGEPIVGKSVNAAFIGTDLDIQLRQRGTRSIVTFGISTDMCVSTTVRVGANLGYRMTVVGDACDCFDLRDERGDVVPAELVHRIHLATLRYEFAAVVTAAEMLDALPRER